LRIGHDPVTGAEVDCIGSDLIDTGAGTDRLIIDLDAGQFGVFIKPLGVKRSRESGACAFSGTTGTEDVAVVTTAVVVVVVVVVAD